MLLNFNYTHTGRAATTYNVAEVGFSIGTQDNIRHTMQTLIEEYLKRQTMVGHGMSMDNKDVYSGVDQDLDGEIDLTRLHLV